MDGATTGGTGLAGAPRPRRSWLVPDGRRGARVAPAAPPGAATAGRPAAAQGRYPGAGRRPRRARGGWTASRPGCGLGRRGAGLRAAGRGRERLVGGQFSPVLLVGELVPLRARPVVVIVVVPATGRPAASLGLVPRPGLGLRFRYLRAYPREDVRVGQVRVGADRAWSRNPRRRGRCRRGRPRAGIRAHGPRRGAVAARGGPGTGQRRRARVHPRSARPGGPPGCARCAARRGWGRTRPVATWRRLVAAGLVETGSS